MLCINFSHLRLSSALVLCRTQISEIVSKFSGTDGLILAKILQSSIRALKANMKSRSATLDNLAKHRLGLALMNQMSQALDIMRQQRWMWQKRISERQSGEQIASPIDSRNSIQIQTSGATALQISSLFSSFSTSNELLPAWENDALVSEVKEPAMYGYPLLLRSDPQWVSLRAQADLYFAQAINIWSQLLQHDPEDAMAYVYRAKTRERWAEGIAPTLLPLKERPPCYPPLDRWKQQVDSASNDLLKAITLLAQRFPDPKLGDGKQPDQETLILTTMAYADAAHLYGLRHKWGEQIQCLSCAIDLKPSIILYLSRAKAYINRDMLSCSAQDCFTSLQRLCNHVPNSQQDEFQQALGVMSAHLSAGDYSTVIRFTLRFWRENAVMLAVD